MQTFGNERPRRGVVIAEGKATRARRREQPTVGRTSDLVHVDLMIDGLYPSLAAVARPQDAAHMDVHIQRRDAIGRERPHVTGRAPRLRPAIASVDLVKRLAADESAVDEAQHVRTHGSHEDLVVRPDDARQVFTYRVDHARLVTVELDEPVTSDDEPMRPPLHRRRDRADVTSDEPLGVAVAIDAVEAVLGSNQKAHVFHGTARACHRTDRQLRARQSSEPIACRGSITEIAGSLALRRRVDSVVMAKPYRRRTGIIRRVGVLGGRPGSTLTGAPTVVDGAEDAPLSTRGRTIFRCAVFLIVALGVALIVLNS